MPGSQQAGAGAGIAAMPPASIIPAANPRPRTSPRPASSRPCDDGNPSRIPRPEDLTGSLTPASRAGNRADPALTRAPRLTQARAPPWRAQRRGQGHAPAAPAWDPARPGWPAGRRESPTPGTEPDRNARHGEQPETSRMRTRSRRNARQAGCRDRGLVPRRTGCSECRTGFYRDSPDGVRRPAVPSDWARHRSPQHPTDRRYRRRPRPDQFLVDRGPASYNRGTSQLR
jgi:hypothetical protein